MVRKFWIALLVVCFTLCISQLVFAAEDNPMPETRDLVKIREGVYEYVAPNGSIQKMYVGIAGIQDRLAGLRRQLDLMNTDGPWDINQLKKMNLLSKEIRSLEKIIEMSLDGTKIGGSNSKILSDCDDSTKNVDADANSGAAVEVYADAEFSAVGSCLAYGAVIAYYWDEGTGTQTESDNSGGFVSSLDIEASVTGGRDGEYCEYASAVLYLNEGGPEYAPPWEYREDCYCPECS